MGLLCSVIAKLIFGVFGIIVIIGVLNPYRLSCSSAITWDVSLSTCSVILFSQYITVSFILSVGGIFSNKRTAIVLLSFLLALVIITWIRNDINISSIPNIFMYYLWGGVGIIVGYFALKNEFFFALLLGLLYAGILLFCTSKIELIKLFCLWSFFLIVIYGYKKYRTTKRL